MAKEAAVTGRAGWAIPFPNEIRMCHSTGMGGQLSPAPARSFHIFEFAGSMKQEQLSSVWCRRTEAITNRTNITESQNSGLANVAEPMSKVKKNRMVALRVECNHSELCIVDVVCSASSGYPVVSSCHCRSVSD